MVPPPSNTKDKVVLSSSLFQSDLYATLDSSSPLTANSNSSAQVVTSFLHRLSQRHHHPTTTVRTTRTRTTHDHSQTKNTKKRRRHPAPVAPTGGRRPVSQTEFGQALQGRALTLFPNFQQTSSSWKNGVDGSSQSRGWTRKRRRIRVLAGSTGAANDDEPKKESAAPSVPASMSRDFLSRLSRLWKDYACHVLLPPLDHTSPSAPPQFGGIDVSQIPMMEWVGATVLVQACPSQATYVGHCGMVVATTPRVWWCWKQQEQDRDQYDTTNKDDDKKDKDDKDKDNNYDKDDDKDKTNTNDDTNETSQPLEQESRNRQRRVPPCHDWFALPVQDTIVQVQLTVPNNHHHDDNEHLETPSVPSRTTTKTLLLQLHLSAWTGPR